MQTVQLVAPAAPVEDRPMHDPVPPPGWVVVRVTAAGICHSDAHYRAGDPMPRKSPIVLGHEIAGTVAAAGDGVDAGRVGQRVSLHYVVSDGTCRRCRTFGEQFCENYEMFGLTIDGGYAEYVAAPAENAVAIPDGISDAHAAVMMCSSATSLHALRKGRVAAGEAVAVVGVGGLGMSAVQLATALGASRVYAVDIDETRLAQAADHGAMPIPAGDEAASRIAAEGGADVALVLVDRLDAFETARASLRPRGRLVAVGIAKGTLPVIPYSHLILGEHELVGSNDHLRGEIDELFAFAVDGRLRLGDVVTEEIPLEAGAINAALDRLDGFGPGVRSVIRP